MASAEVLELKDIDIMIKLLTEKRFQMEADARLTEHTLLQDFLAHLKRLKDDQLIQLKRETSVIQSDLEKITNSIQEIKVQSCDRVPENMDSERRCDDELHDINASNISTSGPGDFSLDQDRYGSGDPTEGIYVGYYPKTFFANVWDFKKLVIFLRGLKIFKGDRPDIYGIVMFI